MAVALKAIDFDAIERRERSRRKGGWIALLVAALVSLIWLMPFYYLLISVFKSSAEYGSGSPLALPNGLSPIVDNAIQVWTDGAGLSNNPSPAGSSSRPRSPRMRVWGLSATTHRSHTRR